MLITFFVKIVKKLVYMDFFSYLSGGVIYKKKPNGV